jgi:DNA-binding GntR family transcriptional regulator
MGAVRRPERATTLSEQVAAAVRADILSGRLRPGERLRLAVLTERHGVSLSVVREALTRLAGPGHGAGERLVHAEPQLGFSVAALSVDEIEDLTAVRCDIEGLALRRAVERGDIAWEARVVAAHHILTNTPPLVVDEPTRVSEEWAAVHADFHAALVEGCGSPLLRQMRRSLYDAGELYRRWSVPADAGHRDVAGEHRALFEASLARDSERAVALLTEHIRHTTRILLAAGLDRQPPEAALSAAH